MNVAFDEVFVTFTTVGSPCPIASSQREIGLAIVISADEITKTVRISIAVSSSNITRFSSVATVPIGVGNSTASWRCWCSWGRC